MKYNNKKVNFLVGIDEVGRGPLAGPVVVAGVKIKNSPAASRFFHGIRDSKQLSPHRREEWYLLLTHDPHISWAVARVSPQIIDRINIARAACLGALRVYSKLFQDEPLHVLLDGSLFLPQEISQETIIRGDENVPIIAAASIIAKVTRDRIMMRIHKKFLAYRFDLHKGYGTRMHKTLLHQYGPTRHHRKTFTFH